VKIAFLHHSFMRSDCASQFSCCTARMRAIVSGECFFPYLWDSSVGRPLFHVLWPGLNSVSGDTLPRSFAEADIFFLRVLHVALARAVASALDQFVIDSNIVHLTVPL